MIGDGRFAGEGDRYGFDGLIVVERFQHELVEPV
jgi:hypothetical protein